MDSFIRTQRTVKRIDLTLELKMRVLTIMETRYVVGGAGISEKEAEQANQAMTGAFSAAARLLSGTLYPVRIAVQELASGLKDAITTAINNISAANGSAERRLQEAGEGAPQDPAPQKLTDRFRHDPFPGDPDYDNLFRG